MLFSLMSVLLKTIPEFALAGMSETYFLLKGFLKSIMHQDYIQNKWINL